MNLKLQTSTIWILGWTFMIAGISQADVRRVVPAEDHADVRQLELCPPGLVSREFAESGFQPVCPGGALPILLTHNPSSNCNERQNEYTCVFGYACPGGNLSVFPVYAGDPITQYQFVIDPESGGAGIRIPNPNGTATVCWLNEGNVECMDCSGDPEVCGSPYRASPEPVESEPTEPNPDPYHVEPYWLFFTDSNPTTPSPQSNIGISLHTETFVHQILVNYWCAVTPPTPSTPPSPKPVVMPSEEPPPSPPTPVPSGFEP